MRRRDFVTLLSGAAAAWPMIARAQQPAMPMIGYLSGRSSDSDRAMVAAFQHGLKETGYVVGANVAIEYRWADGQYDRLSVLVGELVKRNVTVLAVSGGETSAQAAKAATTSIPVVFNIADDPVQFGLVASLNRPGGNLTGVTSLLGAMGTKQFGLIHELAPKAAMVAMLVNPNDPWAEPLATGTDAAARAVGQRLLVLKARTEAEIDVAYATLVQQQAGALLVAASPYFVTRANYLIALAARHAMPTIYFRSEIAHAGGLMSYGTSTAELYGQMGVYAGKILNGSKPADLPVMQATKFELVINLKTARSLGLDIPPTLLARSDEVIE